MEHVLSEVKATLRVNHSVLDNLYLSTIHECLADLRLKGISSPSVFDPNILAAVKLYCQSVHGDPGLSEAFMRRYEKKRDGLAVAKGYGWEEGPNE